MRSMLREKKFYIQLLLFFIVLATLVVLLLSVTFQSIYRNGLLEEVAQTYENDVQRRAFEIDKLVEEIDYVYLSVFTNSDVTRFLDLLAWNPMDEYNVKKQFVRFRNIHSKVRSMYLYSGRLGYFITADDAGQSLTDFPDKAVLDGLSPGRQIRVRLMPAAKPGKPAERVLTFTYSAFNKKDVLESCVVINVLDLSALEMLGPSESAWMLLLDKNGGLLTANTDQLPRGDSLWTGLREEPGSYTARDEHGREYIVSSTPIHSLGWTLVSLHEYSAVLSSVQARTTIVLYIALGALLFSGVLILVFVRRIYRPIDSFVHRMKRSGSLAKDDTQRRSELDYLMDSFDDMLRQMHTARETQGQLMEDARDGFYRRALAQIQHADDLHAQAERLDLNIARAFFCTFVVKIDLFFTIAAHHHTLRKNTVRQIVLDQMRGHFDAAVISMQGGDTAAILCADSAIDPDLLESALARIAVMAQKTLGQSVTIGLGSMVEDFGDIQVSYDMALRAADRRLTRGYGHIFKEDDSREEEPKPHYPAALEKRMLDALHMDKPEEYRLAVEELFAQLKQYDHHSAKLCLTQMLLTLIHHVHSVAGAMGGHTELAQLAGQLSELETIDQSRACFEDMYARYQTLVREISLRKNSSMLQDTIRQAKAYIADNFKNPALSIDEVASHVGYTSNYFAKIYKEETGQFINDSIRECRIDHAKALLVETGLTINEIVELAGYSNTNYFYFAFKKMTGLTPSAYRAQKPT